MQLYAHLVRLRSFVHNFRTFFSLHLLFRGKHGFRWTQHRRGKFQPLLLFVVKKKRLRRAALEGGPLRERERSLGSSLLLFQCDLHLNVHSKLS